MPADTVEVVVKLSGLGAVQAGMRQFRSAVTVPLEAMATKVRGFALGLAGTLAAGPTLAYGAMRRALAYSATHTLEESLANERALMDRTGRTADHLAAVNAFVAKQPMVFTGS